MSNTITAITATPIAPMSTKKRKFFVAQKGASKFGGRGAFMLNLFDSVIPFHRALFGPLVLGRALVHQLEGRRELDPLELLLLAQVHDVNHFLPRHVGSRVDQDRELGLAGLLVIV